MCLLLLFVCPFHAGSADSTYKKSAKLASVDNEGGELGKTNHICMSRYDNIFIYVFRQK